jgi:hypothetical protein
MSHSGWSCVNKLHHAPSRNDYKLVQTTNLHTGTIPCQGLLPRPAAKVDIPFFSECRCSRALPASQARCCKRPHPAATCWRTHPYTNLHRSACQLQHNPRHPRAALSRHRPRPRKFSRSKQSHAAHTARRPPSRLIYPQSGSSAALVPMCR